MCEALLLKLLLLLLFLLLLFLGESRPRHEQGLKQPLSDDVDKELLLLVERLIIHALDGDHAELLHELLRLLRPEEDLHNPLARLLGVNVQVEVSPTVVGIHCRAARGRRALGDLRGDALEGVLVLLDLLPIGRDFVLEVDVLLLPREEEGL